MSEVAEVLEEIREAKSLLREVIETNLDRVMSWTEIAKMTNYSVNHIRTYGDEMHPVMRGGKKIGARKRHVIQWLELNEKKTLSGKQTRNRQK